MFSSINAIALRAVCNHVLGQHAWARQLLSPHAGKTILIKTGLPELPLLGKAPEPCLRVSAKGEFEDPGPLPDAVNVTIRIPDGQWRMGVAAMQRSAQVEGDAELAMVLGKLAQHVRWDPAEDLATFTGDAAAQTITQAAHSLAQQAKSEWDKRVKVANDLIGASSAAPLADSAAWMSHLEDLKNLRESISRLENKLSSSQR